MYVTSVASGDPNFCLYTSTLLLDRVSQKTLKSSQKLFPQIILIWLVLTTTSVCRIETWTSTRKRFHIMNVLWIFDNVHYLRIIAVLKMWKRVLKLSKRKCKWLFLLLCFENKSVEREWIFLLNGDETCARIQRKLYMDE